MPRTASAELSLINGADFLDELEQFGQHDARANEPALEPPPQCEDGYGGLEAGLPIDASAPQVVPYDEGAPTGNPYDEPYLEDRALSGSASAEQRIPFIAVALVLIGCLTAGAATAAVIFHDRLPAISAVASASR